RDASDVLGRGGAGRRGFLAGAAGIAAAPLLGGAASANAPTAPLKHDRSGQPGVVRTGAERLVGDGYAELQGERVGVLSNHTTVLPDLTHLVDAMAESGQVNITAAFGPEHGFRGSSQAAGEEESFI